MNKTLTALLMLMSTASNISYGGDIVFRHIPDIDTMEALAKDTCDAFLPPMENEDFLTDWGTNINPGTGRPFVPYSERMFQ